MEITFDNMHQAISALRKCAKENRNKFTPTGAICVYALCDDVANFLEKLEKDNNEHKRE